ncbi:MULTISPECIES: DUF6538 domain-containing protein [Methylobacterium]|uniref:DUF6538 domain-containing protein n=1 Tax=Methylobacterium TaxID=407 RepID=UPI000ED14834|nr:DUF6538 domain-containing protein [Methylobacterium jeotgali]GBU18619.1 hypothetical protein AwMethylo_28340 [Methylobacterium sp.]
MRKRVPKAVAAAYGRKTVSFSLGTRDPEEARRLHAAEIAKLEQEWARLRSTEVDPAGDATQPGGDGEGILRSLSEREAAVRAQWMAVST